MNRTIPPLSEPIPRTYKYIQLIRATTPGFDFTRDSVQPPLPDFPVMSERITSCARQSPILIHPATTAGRYGDKKNWGTRNFVRFIDRLQNQVDPSIYLTWGPGERDCAESIAEDSATDVHVAPETATITDLAYLIFHARLLITVDSSPAHLADLVRTPVTVIYGVPKLVENAPLFAPYRAVCAGKHQQTSDVSVDRVLHAVMDLWKSSQPP